jgi:hypothetical protein
LFSNNVFTIDEVSKDGETYVEILREDSFSYGNQYALGDSGVWVELVDNSTFISPETPCVFEVRMNSCNSTIRDAVMFNKISENINYPCAIIYPYREWKDPKVSDRYQNLLKIYITIWYEQEPSDPLWCEEFLADVQNELLRDVQLGNCVSYDLHIDEITSVMDENSTERSGALLECSIFYRHSDKNTRIPKN